MNLYVIGVDPGQTTGLMRIRLTRQPERRMMAVRIDALQITPLLVQDALDMLRGAADVAVAMESFVVRQRAGRSGSAQAGALTRGLIEQIRGWARMWRVPLHEYRAADVKPWATEDRLAAAGLMHPTVGMRHARDAGRHALYAAVKMYGLPDPLSRAWERA